MPPGPRRSPAARSGERSLRGPASAPGRVRIIGGQWKRTPLDVPAVSGLRPTPDRVRETLFNWLGQSLDGWRCLDLFAGTGALGFEAASRGACRVVMVERDRAACRSIADAMARLSAGGRVELIEGEAQRALETLRRRGEPPFDLIFLDPPFSEDWIERLWPDLDAALSRAGLVYAEAGRPIGDPPAGWRLERSGCAGQVHYHLLRRMGPTEELQHGESRLPRNL